MIAIKDASKLTMLKCDSCGMLNPEGIFICPGCGGEKLSEEVSSGKGKIFTFTVMNFVPVGQHKTRAPYVLAVVETEEGMRVTAIVDMDDPSAARCEQPVSFDKYEAGVGYVFKG